MAIANVGKRIHYAPALRDFTNPPPDFPVVAYCKTIFLATPADEVKNYPLCADCVDIVIDLNHMLIDDLYKANEELQKKAAAPLKEDDSNEDT